MKYPQIPHDRKRSVKLTLTELEEIRQSYSQGQTFSQLGRKYSVNGMTIKYWVDENYRKHVIKKSDENKMEKYWASEDFRKHLHKISTKGAFINRKRFPEITKYHNFMTKRYKKPKEVIKIYDKARYDKNKSEGIKRSSKWNKNHPERCRIARRRSSRAQNFRGFRMFIKNVDKS